MTHAKGGKLGRDAIHDRANCGKQRNLGFSKHTGAVIRRTIKSRNGFGPTMHPCCVRDLGPIYTYDPGEARAQWTPQN